MKEPKNSKYFRLSRKWFFTLALFILVFAAASAVKIQAAGVVTGWLWGGSEDATLGGAEDCTTFPAGASCIDGDETGVGWISMNGSNYNVSVPDSGCTDCAVKGYGWANASDFPNSSISNEGNGLGWIDFNPQDDCTTAEPGSGKYKAASCTPPSGNAGVFRSGDNLTGWARFVGIAKESAMGNSGGWEGWIKMFNVSINPTTGQMTGFGWNGEEPGTGGNIANGLGWIDFSKAKIVSLATLTMYPDPLNLQTGNNPGTLFGMVKDSSGNPLNGKEVSFLKTGSAKINLPAPPANKCTTGAANPGECSISASATDLLTDETAAVAGTCTGCNSANVTVNIIAAKDCEIKCPPSVEVAPVEGGEMVITPSCEGADCNGNNDKITDCLLPNTTTTAISIDGPIDNKSCEVTAGSGVTFTDSATAVMVSNECGSCSTNVYIKRLGWIETNP